MKKINNFLKSKINSKNLIYIQIIGICLLALGSTYAINYAYQSISASLTTANISVVYVGDNTLTSSTMIPIAQSDIPTNALTATFSVKGAQSNSDIDIIYDVSLSNIKITEGLLNSNFKYELYKNSALLTSGDFSLLEGTSTSEYYQTPEKAILTENVATLPKYTDTADSYTLYVYILDNGLDQSSMMGQTFSADIQIDTYTTKGGSTNRDRYKNLINVNKGLHQITVILSKYGTISTDPSSSLPYNEITITATPLTGHRLISIEIKKTSDNTNITSLVGYNESTKKFTMPDYDVTVNVTFAINTSTLVIDPAGGEFNGSSAIETITNNYNTEIKLFKPQRYGYYFGGWRRTNQNGSLYQNALYSYYTYGPTHNATDTITAIWGEVSHQITVLLNNNDYGSASTNPSSSLSSNEITITATPSTGYRITSIEIKKTWSNTNVTSLVGYNASTKKFTMPDYDVTVNVTFAINTSTLVINLNGGTLDGSSATRTITNNYNTRIEINQPTRVDHAFGGWIRETANGTLIDSIPYLYTYGPTHNATDTITARWIPDIIIPVDF